MAEGLSIYLKGVREFEAALTETVARADVEFRAAVAKAAHLVEAQAKRNLSEGSHRRNEPTTSAPGDPPDLVTGTLRRSIKVVGPTADGQGGYTAMVGPTAVYGRIQELGGIAGNDSLLPPRPYMRPALEELIDSGKLLELYKAAWAAARG